MSFNVVSCYEKDKNEIPLKYQMYQQELCRGPDFRGAKFDSKELLAGPNFILIDGIKSIKCNKEQARAGLTL